VNTSSQSVETADGPKSFRVMLEPLSELLFRDGRPLEAGFIHRGQLPTPQTIAGALRSNLYSYLSGKSASTLGNEIRKNTNEKTEDAFAKAIQSLLPQHHWIADLRFRGPWLVRSYPKHWRRQSELILPTPITVHRTKTGLRYGLLEPALGLPGFMSATQGGMNQSLWSRFAEDSEPVGGYMTANAMSRMLTRCQDFELFEDFANEAGHLAWHLKRSDLVTDVPTTHIRRTLGPNVAEEGKIFSPCSTAFHGPVDCNGIPCPATSILVEMCFSSSIDDTALDVLQDFIKNVSRIPLGGRAKEVRVRPCEVDEILYPLESPLELENSARIALVATAPVVTSNPDCPEFMNSETELGQAYSLVTIAAGQPECYSGWDAARRSPRPTVHTLPAGSVFFLECKGAEHAAIGVEAIKRLNSLSPDPYGKIGWGTFLIGRWEPVSIGRFSSQTTEYNV